MTLRLLLGCHLAKTLGTRLIIWLWLAVAVGLAVMVAVEVLVAF
jgi:hypothetical protein